jgi:hypothetical protein
VFEESVEYRGWDMKFWLEKTEKVGVFAVVRCGIADCGPRGFILRLLPLLQA